MNNPKPHPAFRCQHKYMRQQRIFFLRKGKLYDSVKFIDNPARCRKTRKGQPTTSATFSSLIFFQFSRNLAGGTPVIFWKEE